MRTWLAYVMSLALAAFAIAASVPVTSVAIVAGAPLFSSALYPIDAWWNNRGTIVARYHMNKAEREITDRSAMEAILREGRYAIIALCRDAEPYIVSLSYGYDAGRNALYFHSAAKGLKLDFLASNGAACATVIADGGYVVDQCAHRYRSVVLRGRMQVVGSPEERIHGLETLAEQLETDVAARKEKISRLGGEKWRSMAILRLDIAEMTGKSGQ